MKHVPEYGWSQTGNDNIEPEMENGVIKEGQQVTPDMWAKDMLKDEIKEIDMEEESKEGARLPKNLVIVSRTEWRAKPPLKVQPKPHLTTTVMFSYTTKSKPCFDQKKCCKRARNLQRRYMSVGFPDIPYNFMIGGDGRVYEGRGWNALPQRHPKYNQLQGYMIEIAFIGNWISERPGDPMFDAALDLVQYGRVNFLVKDRFGLIENYD